MRILIIDTYYPTFLKYFWQINPKLRNASYQKQLKKILASGFGTADFYSHNLNQIGHQAKEIIANDRNLQFTWAKEHEISYSHSNLVSSVQFLPFVYKFIGRPEWVQKIVLAQIDDFKPDVVYVQDLSILNPTTLTLLKTKCRLLAGQIASPLPPIKNLSKYDLIITSFPHFVSELRKLKIACEYLPLCFEPRMLSKIKSLPKKYNVSFIGSFSPNHHQGTKILEALASKIPLHVWGPGRKYLSPTSPLLKNYHGQVWGRDMYSIIAQSKIVVNRHIDVAGQYANNMRMYEVTGMGTLLITDHKKNLNDLFKIGSEIISYNSTQDLITQVQKHLIEENTRQKIARSGQKRTLASHSYSARMKTLSKIILSYL